MNMISRAGVLAIALCSVAFVMVFGVVIYQAQQPAPKDPAPFVWLNESNTPYTACPGERIPYEVWIDVSRPGLFFASATWSRSDDHAETIATYNVPEVQALLTGGRQLRGDTIKIQRMGEIPVFGVPHVGLRVDQDSFFSVPSDLPPGEFYRVVVAGMVFQNAEQAIRVQRVTIPDDCFIP